MWHSQAVFTPLTAPTPELSRIARELTSGNLLCLLPTVRQMFVPACVWAAGLCALFSTHTSGVSHHTPAPPRRCAQSTTLFPRPPAYMRSCRRFLACPSRCLSDAAPNAIVCSLAAGALLRTYERCFPIPSCVTRRLPARATARGYSRRRGCPTARRGRVPRETPPAQRPRALHAAPTRPTTRRLRR
jgi:hypothetical protein